MYKKIEVMDILCSLGLEKVEAEEKIEDYNNFMSDLNKEEYKETVDHPNHYNTGKYDALEVIEDCANLRVVDGLAEIKACDLGKECIDRNLFRPKEIKADKIQPSYYHKGKVDTIKFCLENDLDFLQGNIVKYVVRYKEKNGLEDLNKAMEYLKRLIESENNK